MILRTFSALTLFSALASLTVGCSSEAPSSDDGSDEGATTSAATCDQYIAPDNAGACTSCHGSSCQANGCYNGYWCHATVGKCVAAPPSGCSVSNGPVILSSFETPTSDGLNPVIDAINGAHASIRMAIYHLTVQAVVDALANASSKNHVDVQIIVDQANWNQHTPQALKTELANAGVKVTPSSTGFRITHEKSFVVDESVAYIMSLNLTSPYTTTRDYAVVTNDKGVVQEFLSVFDADLQNAANGTSDTPALSSPYLVWSPSDSESRLVSLIQSAKKTIVVSSENLGDDAIDQALIAAAKAKVDVRIIAPHCDQNIDVYYDMPTLKTLNDSGVKARAIPSPSSADVPYEHAKMILVDGKQAYIGSVNLSTASMTNAREVGILFDDPSSIKMISDAFEHDWATGLDVTTALSVKCP